MDNSYKNAEHITLSDYIPADKFRTVISEYRHIGGGYSEIPVEIHMKPEFVKTLSFKVDWDGVVYGHVRGKRDILEKLSEFSSIRLITISDWDGQFRVIFEGTEENKEKAFFVKPEEVRELLENCFRAPEQKSIK
jgi:hypothetical protein